MSQVEIIEASRAGPNSRRWMDRGGAYSPEGIRVAAYVRVSTAHDEQLGSFKSQKAYYEEKIRSNPEWVMAGIFADEAITGTKVEKREQFLEMIDRCMRGEIDMILTKSISRFARNTLDTLKYVRKLKEKKIAIIFEKENIDTLSMNGELLLTIMSSLAQQEVESLSANVKMGHAMRMSRGELIGFSGCLGYDYQPDTKSLSLNPEEAETVRLIYDLYLKGYGGSSIAQTLTAMGKKNKKGAVFWTGKSVICVIKNEKYKGDLLLGKTFRVDPIGKRMLFNNGEEKKYYFPDHHEPIVSKEVWEKAQEIRLSRSRNRPCNVTENRERIERMYAFSGKCICGFCGSNLTRRTRQQTSIEYKPVWQCREAVTRGIDKCPDCKSIDESVLKSAFQDSLWQLFVHFDDVFDELLSAIEEVIRDDKDNKHLLKVNIEINRLESQNSVLTGQVINGKITRTEFDRKLSENKEKLNQYLEEKSRITEKLRQKKSIDKRMQELRHTLETCDPLDQFDQAVFDSIVEKVIVGDYDPADRPSPYKLIFVLKGTEKSKRNHSLSWDELLKRDYFGGNSVMKKQHIAAVTEEKSTVLYDTEPKGRRKKTGSGHSQKAVEKSRSSAKGEQKIISSSQKHAVERHNPVNDSENYLEILSFRHFTNFWRYDKAEKQGRRKEIIDSIEVSVVLHIKRVN